MAWAAVSVLVAVAVGRVIARRERQIPFRGAPTPESRLPERARAILRMGRRD